MKTVHLAQGALLAGDGIPLHYGDQAAEYQAALHSAVLMDRSHEGRLELTGRDRLAIIHRLSTQDVEQLPSGAGRPTLFTNPNARIIERALVCNLGERALAFTGPGRGAPLQQYLRRNIFFQDELHIRDLEAETYAFALHGPAAAAIIAQAIPAMPTLSEMMPCVETTVSGVPIIAARTDALSGTGWLIMAARAEAEDVWRALHAEGAAHGLRAAGSLTYNILRIRAGRPGVGRELTLDYIPLELGLWDEVSFNKGCYTGQEIIARMESRGRLARTLVRLRLSAALDAPAALLADDRSAGTLTSSVTTPEGEHLGIGVVRLAYAQPGQVFSAGANIPAVVLDLAGVQPPGLKEESA
jgi:folate-binding protein YgfZ